MLPVDTVIVSTRATIGRIGIARTQLATNQGFKNITIKRPDLILPKYVAYMLTAQVEAMQHLASGATFKEISKENFCTLQIPLLPIDQQQLIVDELDGYQRVIAGSKAVLANYRPTISCKANNLKALDEIAVFKPSKEEIRDLSGETEVSFVPMSCINTYDASFTPTEVRALRDVSTGFTYFRDNDVLLA